MPPKSKRNGSTSAQSPAKRAKAAYGWKELNVDLDAGNYLGEFGANNGVYQAVAECQAGRDLNEHHCLRHDDEHMVNEIVDLLKDPQTKANWDKVISINPNGLHSRRPTIAATYARMDMPELSLIPDGIIVNEDKSINVIKAGLEPVWNIPAIADRLNIAEPKLRKHLARYTKIPNMEDSSQNAFLPAIGGATVYFFGDPRRLLDKTKEVAVRCHDECNGSDVFCTDICTCRPYLLFAIQAAVETAQRGGVGLVVYFRKEGRALGEVTKYRVYNARKNQAGGDRPEMYFKQTEAIAGIRDARLQELMPDVLVWLGVTRIDWLLSMSSEKYDAITGAGIEVMQRVSLPEDQIPRDAHVEISAKITAGYHCDEKEHDVSSTQKYLLTLQSIRDRCSEVYKFTKSGQSKSFALDESKLSVAKDEVLAVLKKSYPDPMTVPYHSRARHFELPDGTDLLQQLFDKWTQPKTEKVRRLVDLSVISVLLDAGAGNAWTFLDKKRLEFSRSEGLAMASYEAFCDGFFSSDRATPHRVNSLGLSEVTEHDMNSRLQISDSNSIIGLEGRVKSCHKLAACLDGHPNYFGTECPRPGNMVDHVMSKVVEKDGEKRVSVLALWEVVIEGMGLCWPARNATVHGLSNGDVWQFSQLKKPGQIASDVVPFHKLPQWMMYSLVEVFERFLGLKFDDMHLLTGLAEYRNGGLFIDSGVLKMLRAEMGSREHDVGSEVVVEWRALTVILLDKVADLVRADLGLDATQFPLAKVLQAGTWQAGRVLAKRNRPGGPSPIQVRLDGTVF